MPTTPKHQVLDVYALVTNRIIELLEQGVIPWQQPWTESGLPKNLISGRPYRGVNVWLLNSLQYQHNIFLTYRQAKDLGATIKKGEKACPVVFWKWVEKENMETKEIERIPLLRYYNVFNMDQCSGIILEKIPPTPIRTNSPIESCEKIIAEMPMRPQIHHKENRAYYNKVLDYVNIPHKETFTDSESYYGILFHEICHSTGHQERLNRRELTHSQGFRTEEYAMEELTAEMGASYLKSYAGIPIEQLENNAAYIQSWLERLKKDKKCIIYASSQAQKATDFILNVRSEEKELDQEEQVLEQEKSSYRKNELQEIRHGIQVDSIDKER